MSQKVRQISSRQVSVTWKQALEDFLLFKQGQGLAEITIKDYLKHISGFFKCYPSCWPSSLDRGVLEYMAKPVSPAYFNLKLIYLKGFFNWAIAEGILETNPLAGIKKKRDEGKVRNLDEVTVKKLLELPNRKTFAGLRDYALLLLTMDTGIRPGEALQLTLEDTDLSSLTVTVRPQVSKTRRTRLLPVSLVTAKAIKKLTGARHPLWPVSTPVFCSFEGGKLSVNGWYQRLAAYSDRLGVKVTPYSLRHSFAVMYLRAGGNAFCLQHTLGHSDMQMTKRYVNLTNSDLADTHRLASPLNTLCSQGKRVRRI